MNAKKKGRKKRAVHRKYKRELMAVVWLQRVAALSSAMGSIVPAINSAKCKRCEHEYKSKFAKGGIVGGTAIVGQERVIIPHQKPQGFAQTIEHVEKLKNVIGKWGGGATINIDVKGGEDIE